MIKKRFSLAIVLLAVIIALTLPLSVAGAELRKGSDFWYNVGNVLGETFTVDGNTAYCVNPGAPIPSDGEYSEEVVENVSLLKVLYYGYGGPGFDNNIKAKMDSYRNNSNITASGNDLYYALTHRCAAKAYGSQYKFDWYDDWNSAIDSVYAYLQTFNRPTGCKAYVINANSASQTIAFLVEDDSILLQLLKKSTNPGISANNNCYSLAGAQFGVYSDAACTKQIGTITTNKSGFGQINVAVPVGDYYAKELVAPPGYALSETVFPFVKSKVTTNTGLAVYLASPLDVPQNDPIGILLNKIDADGKPLEGAEFTVSYYVDYYTEETVKDASPMRSWVLKTDSKGGTALDSIHLVSGDEFYMTTTGNPCLPLGTVTIQETKAPAGYVVDSTLHTFKITGDQTDSEFVESFNTPEIPNTQTETYISKTDITGQKELAGAKLTVKNDKDEVVESWTSTTSAHLIKGLVAGKTYTLIETKSPDGYTIAEPVTFTVNSDGKPTYVTMKDEETITRISKTDITGDNELEGATLQVFDSKGNLIEEWISKKAPHYIYGLVAGKTYKLVETISPNGYSIAKDIEFTVKSDGSVTYVVMKDDLTVTVVSKKSVTGEDELPGAQLQILDENDKVIDEWTSTDKPHTIKGLIAGKKYKLVETLAPDGYSIATPDEFTVNEDGSTTYVELKNDLTLTTVTKTDMTGEKELSGANLQVVDEDGNIIDEWISGDESHKIQGLIAGKTYTLIETISPDGYTTSEAVEFTVNSDGSATAVNMKDDVTRYKFIKVDDENNPIKGAKLQLLDADGKVVEEWTTDGTAHVIEGKLVVGKKYTLHEAEAPEGYEKAEDHTFEIKDTSELQTITMVDKYTGGVRISTPDQPVTPSNSYGGSGTIQTGQQFPIILGGIIMFAGLMIILFRKRKKNI